MIAFGFLLFIIGIFVLINTLNGNLPGLVNIPGFHDATTGIRGLYQPASTNTTTSKSTAPTDAGGNPILLQSGNQNLGDFLNQQAKDHPDWITSTDGAAAQAQQEFDWLSSVFNWGPKKPPSTY